MNALLPAPMSRSIATCEDLIRYEYSLDRTFWRLESN
jgi:hypothetical protein